ncbi:hypothetical protein [Verrucomicrobium sp. BvORR034]|uniref:hypothetical protein n=1 Tax=Verrucomicrobium sp. BvORR034 TaxID=1396418 RepID=UPI002240ECC7|nr:hypothetical protein [Verrucomicrobium sp. BvORR034]
MSSSIKKFYPSYSQRLLEAVLSDYLSDVENYLGETGRGHYNIARSFQFEEPGGQVRARLRGRKVCCMSLFFKAATHSRYKNQPAKDPNGDVQVQELHAANHPAFEGTHRYNSTFYRSYIERIMASRFEDWQPVLFLAKDLHYLRREFESKGWIVIQMVHSSVAHSPGAMWRYLGFNLDCKCCYFHDTDSQFSARRADQIASLLTLHPSATLARSLQWSGQSGEMALILGHDFAVNPKRIDFDAAKMMLGYAVLNILLEDRVNNFCVEPRRGRETNEIATLAERAKREHFGPTYQERVLFKCYPYYCFDEQWLKEFVYYQMVNGKMVTFQGDKRQPVDEIQSADIEFQVKNGNLLASSFPLLDRLNGGASQKVQGRNGSCTIGSRGGRASVGKRALAQARTGLRTVDEASYFDYQKWYLGRELAKQRIRSDLRVQPVEQMFECAHSGKVREYFSVGKWSLVRMDAQRDFEQLIFLDDAQTREEGLVINVERPNYRTLLTVANNAINSDYIQRCSSANLKRYYEDLKSGRLRIMKESRIVICEPNGLEKFRNPEGNYYIVDGAARCLAYMMLIVSGQLQYDPIEAFYCEPAGHLC